MDEFIAFMERYLQVAAEEAPYLSEEESAAIEQFIQEAIDFIQSAQQPQVTTAPPTPPSGPQAPPVPPGEHESSNINGFKYDPKTKQLYIQFHGPYPQAEGPVYSYQGVPEYIFEVLRRGAVGPRTTGRNRYHAWHRGITPSLGAAVAALIKRAPYPYQRVA